MGFMDAAGWIEYGIPGLLIMMLISQAIGHVRQYYTSNSINEIKRDINSMKTQLIWNDEYKADQRKLEERKEEIDRRVNRLEMKANSI